MDSVVSLLGSYSFHRYFSLDYGINSLFFWSKHSTSKIPLPKV